MAAEMARLNPPVPITQSAVPEFDRFARFSKVYTIKLLSEVENRVLALALKGAGDRVRDRFFQLMESRQEAEVRECLHNIACVRINDVEEAQRHILEIAKRNGEKADGDA
ncbi:MAG: FliG C-terminal domain-containing protein, partial [Pseudoflavonifractor sp.]